MWFYTISESLDIHHEDPATKDPDFVHRYGWSFDRLMAEIVGCILLCKNCHQAHHSGYNIWEINSAVEGCHYRAPVTGSNPVSPTLT